MNKAIHSLPLQAISIEDRFWKRYMELIRQKVIPRQWDILNNRAQETEPSHCIWNFKVASGELQGEFKGMVFQDSDVYKWLEAVAYSLSWHPDKELEAVADSAIDIICAAQQPDGYLNTYYIIKGLDKRFTNLRDNHEFYCLGHLLEAAIAYFQATGKRKLLNAAIRYVDCVDGLFGSGDHQIHGYPGHEIIEMALVRLYRLTREKKYVALAKYFIDERGREPIYFREEAKRNKAHIYWNDTYQYYQADRPVRQQDAAEGHAVRAVYLYSGMTDTAVESDDKELLEVCEKLWDNITQRQLYITGGIGATSHGEAFTYDYDLPNDTVYAETCASIGLVFFAIRLFDITGDSKYTDVIERALYNGIISGIALDGARFFYVNPLEVVPQASEMDHLKRHVRPERQKWFACACCPPNLARLIMSLGKYCCSVSEDTFWMNLFVGGTIHATFQGQDVVFRVKTEYPWTGVAETLVEVTAPATFSYAVRIPQWCSRFKLLVNDDEVVYQLRKGYAYMTRQWHSSDKIVFSMDMPVQIVCTNPKVRENIGKVAVTRGPLVYCLEEADNGKELHKVCLNQKANFELAYESEILAGVVTLTSPACYISEKAWSHELLYQPCDNGFEYEERTVKWIPYYAWTNRTPGEMTVWVHTMTREIPRQNLGG